MRSAARRTLVLAVLAFPVALFIGPVYVAVALGQWIPLLLVYVPALFLGWTARSAWRRR